MNKTERTLIDAARDHLPVAAVVPGPFPHVMQVSDPCNVTTRFQDLEALAPAPRRLRQGTTHETPRSFVAYLRDFKGAETRIFASLANRAVVGAIDYHAPTDEAGDIPAPSWVEHRAVYPAVFDPGFAAWHDLHGKPIPQKAFARFLEDRADDVVTPSPADLMEVAARFDALRSVTFRSAVNLSTGEREFQYETKDATKGSVAVPKLLLVRTPVFQGCDPVEWVARFAYDIDEGALVFKVTIHRLAQLLDAEFERLCDWIAVDLPGVPLHRGVMG